MDVTFSVPAEHIAPLLQKQSDVLDPGTGAPTGERTTSDRPYAWAEVKFDPRSGRVLYTALRDNEVGDGRYFALEDTAQVEIGDEPSR
jgi:hypothetical protein